MGKDSQSKKQTRYRLYLCIKKMRLRQIYKEDRIKFSDSKNCHDKT